MAVAWQACMVQKLVWTAKSVVCANVDRVLRCGFWGKIYPQVFLGLGTVWATAWKGSANEGRFPIHH
jgi:hypothetical protein